MNINKVVYGDEVLIDTSGVTVTPQTLAEGVTALDASGTLITGEMSTKTVLYEEQTLTDEQKAQARANIAPSDAEVTALLAETDMIPAVYNADGSVLTDENGNVILRY